MTMTLLCMTLLTYAHDLAVGHQTGAQLRVLKVLCSHQHADNLSSDESIIEALLGCQLGGELAVHVQRPLGVRWLQHLHQFDVGIVHLQEGVSGIMHYSSHQEALAVQKPAADLSGHGDDLSVEQLGPVLGVGSAGEGPGQA